MKFKKFLCYLLCGILTFTVISTANYKSAHAMEWVSGALSFAETLTWVLASLGITCTVSDYAAEVDKSRAEFWEDYEQEFYDYVNEHDGNTASDRFIEWKNKLCKGVLDKSSEYWGFFKSWASDLVNGSSSCGGSGSVNVPEFYSNNSVDFINYLRGFYNVNYGTPNFQDFTFDYAFLQVYGVGSSYPDGNLYLFQVQPTINANGIVSSTRYYYTNLAGTSGSKGWSTANINLSTWVQDSTNNRIISDNVINNSNITFDYFSNGGVVADSNFDSVTSNVDDLDVISSDGVDEDNPEVTLPYPGVSDSDDTISSDAYQDIIDAINDGTITQVDGVIEIQKILKIITYDTVTDDVVPPIKDDDGNNKKKDDVLKENKENMGFTLGGLEAVFPFCIPFDIYAFMTLLVAEPECPEFDFPIKSVNGEVEEIHIDLEPFEPVAVVVRYCFDFLFIIGLAMLTRSLIGGGGSD